MQRHISFVAVLPLLLMLIVFATASLGNPQQALAVPSLMGDVDADGDLDANDANLLTAEIAAGTNDFFFDVNDDGVVDSLDLDLFFVEYSTFSGVPLATALVDVNFDTLNTSADYDIIINNLSLPLTAFTAGNLFMDGLIDAADVGLYLSRGGVVPEPATLWLVLWTALIPLRNRRSESARGGRAAKN